MCSFRIKWLWSYIRLLSFLLGSPKGWKFALGPQGVPREAPCGSKEHAASSVTAPRTAMSRMGSEGSGSRVTLTPADKAPGQVRSAGASGLGPTLWPLCAAISFLPLLVNPQISPQGVSTDGSLLAGKKHQFLFGSSINKLALSAWSFSRDPWATLRWRPAIFGPIQHVYFFIGIHVWVSFESNLLHFPSERCHMTISLEENQI